MQSCYTDAANARSAGRARAETKRCRRCGSTKEAQDFYVSKMTADGLQSYCKACYAVASAARRGRNAPVQVSLLSKLLRIERSPESPEFRSRRRYVE